MGKITMSVTAVSSAKKMLICTISEYLKICHNLQKTKKLYESVIKDVEKVLINKVMQITNFNKSQSARILGISRNTLNAKLSSLKLKYKF